MPPLGGAVERGEQDLEGALWNRSFYSLGVGSQGAVTGRPEPLRRSTNKRGTRSRQQAREGGGPEGGGGPPGNPSLSGTCGSGRRRGHTADPSPRQALARLPARRLPEDLGGDAGPWVSKPGAQRTKLTSAKGQGGVTKWALSLGAGPFLKGKAKKHPESGLAEGY